MGSLGGGSPRPPPQGGVAIGCINTHCGPDAATDGLNGPALTRCPGWRSNDPLFFHIRAGRECSVLLDDHGVQVGFLVDDPVLHSPARRRPGATGGERHDGVEYL
ncbi:hypothetical protein ACFFX0_22060 [Citricoccus parietis]|uniref:Uncharacterized protein n=1 Tax=Citricoccus parietis TaxID=592307 RepID=A0ABV5G470_9MICC